LILESSEFAFEPSPHIGRARQILIKPAASSSQGYPITTSPEIMEAVISTIREVSEADILILDGSPDQESMEEVYHALGYKFPRVHMLDVRDCILVEVENPLPHPFVMSTFWLPNLVLYCDYLISISPCKIVAGQGDFTVTNLLSLLPVSKYRGESENGWGALYSLGIQKVAADLYFTLPFDLGILEARTKLVRNDDSGPGEEESYGKVFVGEPYEVDKEASEAMGLSTDYLRLIEGSRSQVQF